MKKLIVANWKQNLNISEGSQILHRLQEEVRIRKDIEIAICPSFVSLHPLHRQIDHKKFKLGAQAIHWDDNGPATGEIGGPMLRGIVKYAIVGHSYRRANMGVTDEIIGKKVSACIRNDIMPIICIGENAAEKAEGRSKQVIKSQLDAALAGVTSADIGSVVLASEPSWAISTNKGHRLPLPDEITEPISFIRDVIADRYGKKATKDNLVLYGGSVTADTSKEYIVLEGVDGFLIGGASLKHKEFAKIIDNVHNMSIGN